MCVGCSGGRLRDLGVARRRCWRRCSRSHFALAAVVSCQGTRRKLHPSRARVDDLFSGFVAAVRSTVLRPCGSRLAQKKKSIVLLNTHFRGAFCARVNARSREKSARDSPREKKKNRAETIRRATSFSRPSLLIFLAALRARDGAFYEIQIFREK